MGARWDRGTKANGLTPPRSQPPLTSWPGPSSPSALLGKERSEHVPNPLGTQETGLSGEKPMTEPGRGRGGGVRKCFWWPHTIQPPHYPTWEGQTHLTEVQVTQVGDERKWRVGTETMPGGASWTPTGLSRPCDRSSGSCSPGWHFQDRLPVTRSKPGMVTNSNLTVHESQPRLWNVSWKGVGGGGEIGPRCRKARARGTHWFLDSRAG